MGGNDKDPKVKDLFESGAPLEDVVDAATAEALQRWFGLPSFTQLAEEAPVEDAETVAVRERREQAVAAVDPAFVERLAGRWGAPDAILVFQPDITLRVDPSCARTNYDLIERGHVIAEPREVEISAELQSDLGDCTPQALLRDLHRAELRFDKVFEIVDVAAEQRFDIVAFVKDAMATNWKLPELRGSVFAEGAALMAELADQRRKPWTDIPRPNRRVQD